MDYFNQESERLIYRKLTEEDISNWEEFFIDNTRIHFLGIHTIKDPVAHSTEWINKQLDRYASQGLGHLAVIEKLSGKFIGMGGILPRELNNKPEYEISYSIKPTSWGKGYGTEIARHFKSFGLKNKISDHFISIIHKENEPSMNVARKNGMNILYETEFLDMPVFVFGDRNE